MCIPSRSDQVECLQPSDGGIRRRRGSGAVCDQFVDRLGRQLNVGDQAIDAGLSFDDSAALTGKKVAIIGYGFTILKLSNVEAHTYSNNVRAKKLLEKLGFRLDIISEDSHYYFISKENWTKLCGAPKICTT